MAIVKFVASGCPMNNILGYVMREEATERKLIDGIMCTPETALEEFRFVVIIDPMARPLTPPSNLYVKISSLVTTSVTRSRMLFIAPVHAIWSRRLSSSVTPSFAAYCRTR